MAKARRTNKSQSSNRVQRVKLTPEETMRRMQDFDKRKEQFIASVRKGKNRGLSA